MIEAIRAFARLPEARTVFLVLLIVIGVPLFKAADVQYEVAKASSKVFLGAIGSFITMVVLVLLVIAILFVAFMEG